jgi:hypothetical protein
MVLDVLGGFVLDLLLFGLHALVIQWTWWNERHVPELTDRE